MNDLDFDDVMDGAASIAVAVYIVACLYQGNIKQLGLEVIKEGGYLEAIIAAYILWKLYHVNSIRPIVGALLFAAILAAIIQAARNFDPALFSLFGSGRITLFDLVIRLAKGK